MTSFTVYIIFNFSDKSNIFSSAERVRADVGEVDVLINNAGIVQGKRLLDSADDVILKTFQVNLLAHFWVSVCIPLIIYELKYQ